MPTRRKKTRFPKQNARCALFPVTQILLIPLRLCLLFLRCVSSVMSKEEITAVAGSRLLKSSVHFNKSAARKRNALDTHHPAAAKKRRRCVNAKRQLMWQSGSARKQSRQFDKSAPRPLGWHRPERLGTPLARGPRLCSISLHS